MPYDLLTRTRAGKKEGEAPTVTIVANQKAPNLMPSVRNVPIVVARVGFAAIEPATDIMKIMGR